MSADLYQRPSRDAIAAKVLGQLPGAPPPEPEPEPEKPSGALANFAACLRARLRALGWEQAALQERLDISAITAARALNGTGVSLDLADRIAALVGRDLITMLQAYQCGTCHGEPPTGFACLECGAERRATAERTGSTR